METGPTLQMGIELQLSMAVQTEINIRMGLEANKLARKFCIPAQQIDKGHMPLLVFQPLTESRHLLEEIHLVSVIKIVISGYNHKEDIF